MTLAQLNAKLKIGVARPDLTSDDDDNYSAYVNEAQKEICRLHSFNWMRTTARVTVLSGTSSIALPSNFKELVSDESPVFAVTTSGSSESLLPVAVWLPEKAKRWQNSSALTADGVPVYVDRTFTPPKLSMGTSVAGEDIVFEVSYYAFRADLSADSDHNALTDDHSSMLLEKAKALAFEDVNDFEMVEASEKIFVMKFSRAKRSDTYSRVAGQNLHM